MDVNFTLVLKRTMLEDLIKKYNTVEQAQFYITHLGQDFQMYLDDHNSYHAALETITAALKKYGRVHSVYREYLSNYIFGKDTIVIVLGPDGLVANTMKYLDHQVIIGINYDPKKYDGILLPFGPNNLKAILPGVISGKREIKRITMAKAVTSDKQELYAVNDLFIGAKSHVSARYQIEFNQKSEMHSSSGIIISTGLGSTGWLKGILSGSYGLVSSLLQLSQLSQNPGKKKAKENQGEQGSNSDTFLQMFDIGSITGNLGLGWESEQLAFSVREPFPSKSSQAQLVFGLINSSHQLKITSNMAQNGVIFSDGIESDFLNFTSGVEATISVADRKGNLVV